MLKNDAEIAEHIKPSRAVIKALKDFRAKKYTLEAKKSAEEVKIVYPLASDMPGANDARWPAWTKPLYDFMAGYRTWDELTCWRDVHKLNEGVLQQLIAWLSLNGLASSREGGWQSHRNPTTPSPFK